MQRIINLNDPAWHTDHFNYWLVAMGYTGQEAGRQLGISQPTFRQIRDGGKEVPRYIMLSCKMLMLARQQKAERLKKEGGE